jgi:hypothetical protein
VQYRWVGELLGSDGYCINKGGGSQGCRGEMPEDQYRDGSIDGSGEPALVKGTTAWRTQGIRLIISKGKRCAWSGREK